MKKTYTSDEIEVYFEPKRCIHAAECVNGLPEVFDTEKRPWIDPEKSDAQTIAEIVERCPSGALTYHRLDGGEDETHDETTIRVGEDGELYVEGNFTLNDGNQEVKLNRTVLTNSKDTDNPPFYDKSLSERK